jgi:hypothetical protein
MNPNDEKDRTRLFRAVEASYRALNPFRRLNSELVKEYAGTGYGGQRTGQETIVALMTQVTDAYGLALAANRPRVLLTAQNPELTYFARHFGVALNSLIEEIGLEFKLRQWVLDAFFCVGVIKVHLADSGFVQLEQGRWADPGKPYASNVNLDNWVHDMGATSWDQVKFAGDTYRIPFADLEESDIYDPAAVADLKPTTKNSLEGDRLDEIAKGSEVDQDELEPMIDLCDLWIPREGKIYTFALDNRHHFQMKGKPLAEMPWDGNELGPYHLLGFNDVPENIMPTSPASHLSALARMANNLYRKQKRQAQRQKDVYCFRPGDAKSAEQIRNAEDGQMVSTDEPDAVKVVKQGGVDPGNQAFLLGTIEMFDRMAGNLTATLGLGAQADTASQEQLIHGAVSKKEASMSFRVVDGTTRLVKDLAHMLWKDQYRVSHGQIPIDGTDGYSVDATWTPDDREGDFFDYKIEVDAYSMRYKSPAERLGTITQTLTQFIMPALPMMAQQGLGVDFKKVIDTIAELANEPRLKEIITTPGIPLEEGQGPGDEMPAPPSTTRSYIRKSVPSGGSAQSRSRVAQSEWMGKASQATPQQSASLSRPAA